MLLTDFGTLLAQCLETTRDATAHVGEDFIIHVARVAHLKLPALVATGLALVQSAKEQTRKESGRVLKSKVREVTGKGASPLPDCLVHALLAANPDCALAAPLPEPAPRSSPLQEPPA